MKLLKDRDYLGYRKQGAVRTCGLVSFIVGWAIYVSAMMDESIAGMLLSGVLLLYAAAIGIWVFVDFIRILTGGLIPEDGSAYSKTVPFRPGRIGMPLRRLTPLKPLKGWQASRAGNSDR